MKDPPSHAATLLGSVPENLAFEHNVVKVALMVTNVTIPQGGFL